MLMAVFAMDERMLAATGGAAEGQYTTGSWSATSDNPVSRSFVERFRKAHNRIPTIYAGQAYDTARLIASALRATGGDMRKTDEFRAALRRADFPSIRGRFRFDVNQHPIQDYYLMQVERAGDGELQHRILRRIAEARPDAYVGECKMPSA